MTFSTGSLVKARGRKWVVLPDSTDDLLILHPLGGSDDEITGIYLPLETVSPVTFDLPNPKKAGDYCSARMLRDAVRLGFRSSAGPFRSFARNGEERGVRLQRFDLVRGLVQKIDIKNVETPAVEETMPEEARQDTEDRTDPIEQPMLSDFGLYKCEVCGKMVMGYEKANHEQEKHGGKGVEWKKM